MHIQRWVAAFALILIVSACSSSSKKSSSSSSSSASGSTATTVAQAAGATTTVAPGDDQKNSPFCQDLVKLDKITNATDPSVATLVADAKAHAPQTIASQFGAMADYIEQAAATKTTASSLPAAEQTALANDFEAVSAYSVGHCGINLSAP